MFHALITNSDTLNAGSYGRPVDGLAANILVFTPLHVVWLGAEAVYFFFILSGFVLTRAASRPSFSWAAYFPSRMVRLYVPVIAAVTFAWVSYKFVFVFLVAAPQVAYSTSWAIRDMLLLGGTSTYMGVLWSLQWEVIFSLALPVYLLLVRQHRITATVIALAVCLVGFFLDVQGPSVLPMFFFGALLAQQWDWIVARFRFLATRSVLTNLAASALTVAALVALTSFFLSDRWLQSMGLSARTITTPLVLAGICMLIILSMLWPPVRSFLGLRPLVFLGKMSYSLYLVHLPIVLILATVLPRGFLTAVLSIVVSLLISCAFHFAVEKPSHGLAHRIGARQRLLDQAPVESVET
jgi:peptidoglycan/LPS O-acetylase OafA/YrhL